MTLREQFPTEDVPAADPQLSDVNPVDQSPHYTSWDQFDVQEYVQRNYGNKILEEDRFIIEHAANAIRSADLRPASLSRISDVGAGPNMYPSMLLAPFVKPVEEGGQIELIEYSAPNRSYAQSVIDGTDTDGPLGGIWGKFESFIKDQGPEWTGDVFKDVRQKAHVVAGSIDELPKEKSDAVVSFFVPESTTDNWAEFERRVNSLLDFSKPGGFLMVAHMLGSKGYPAGEGTKFPAISLTMEDLKKVYVGKADGKIIHVEAPPRGKRRRRLHGVSGGSVLTQSK